MAGGTVLTLSGASFSASTSVTIAGRATIRAPAR
jgi:hypothetical protein